MDIEKLEAKVKDLEEQLMTVRDIQEIERLQRIYGYYLEHWMAEEIVNLFADGPDVGLEWPEGKYLGKDGVRRYFTAMEQKNPEFMHQLMQLSPVIDVDPDGKGAKGRFFSYGAVSIPKGGGVTQSYMSGTYENEYIKEDGKWKIKRITWHLNYIDKPGEGWVKPERIIAIKPNATFSGPSPDIPDTRFELKYPSGHIFPFHFNHPVTGKKTTEGKRNESTVPVKDRFPL
jgi:hypothetical protein